MSLASITDAQRRLLAAIGQRLPLERVRELYLFAPIRQGGVETGLAVIASGEPEAPPPEPAGPVTAEPVTEEPVTEEPEAETSGALAGEPAAESGAAPEVGAEAFPDAALACTPQEPEMARAAVLAAEAAVEARLAAEACDPTEAAAGAPPAGEAAGEAADTLPAERLEEIADEALADAADLSAGPAPQPEGDEGMDATAPDAALPPERPARFTVYTARYRLQLKGPDRGKWEVEVVEEADAPLLSVDAVVRGVQRRAGELVDVDRLSGADLVRLLAGAP